jgi:hypothetical protein
MKSRDNIGWGLAPGMSLRKFKNDRVYEILPVHCECLKKLYGNKNNVLEKFGE